MYLGQARKHGMFDDVSVAGRHVKRVDERGGLGTVSRLGIAFLASGLEEPLEQLAVLQFGQVDVLAAGLGDLERDPGDRKSVVEGKSVSVRVDLGARRNIKKKNTDIGDVTWIFTTTLY